MRKLLATTAAGLTLFGGSIAIAATGLTGVASAQSSTPTTQAAGQPTGQKGDHANRRHVAKEALKEVAKDLDMSPKDLLAELRSGKTVNQIAQEKGVPSQTIVDDLVGKVGAKVDKAVSEGKLTQEQGDKIKAKAPERIAKLMDRQLPAKAQK